MKKTTILLLPLLAFLLSSCGRSESEKSQIRANITALQNQIEDFTGKLTAGNDEMERIKAFHIGRSEAERNSEIEQQSKYIQQLTDGISNDKAQIATLQKELN